MEVRVLPSLSPARRRLVVGIVVLAHRDPPVRPVSQEQVGPVLLVPGYGGSTVALEVLADALAAVGRDVRVVEATGTGTGDLRQRAVDLGRAVEQAIKETGAPSVDVIGYSAGGVVLRIYVADLRGGSTVRRAITLASPHHGTDLASLAASTGAQSCPVACMQLVPDSDLLRELNAGDETPPGPVWVALWTEGDETVVPASSGDIEGALGYSVPSVCTGPIGVRRRLSRCQAQSVTSSGPTGRVLLRRGGERQCRRAGQARRPSATTTPVARPCWRNRSTRSPTGQSTRREPTSRPRVRTAEAGSLHNATRPHSRRNGASR